MYIYMNKIRYVWNYYDRPTIQLKNFVENLITVLISIIKTIHNLIGFFYYKYQKSRSLTYLDIRSNGITAIGLSGITESLLTRCALSVLDISNNNDVIESDILRGEKKLRENGVICELRRGAFTGSSSTSFSTVMRSINQVGEEETETGIVRVDGNQATRCVRCTVHVLLRTH
jgi:hypothetical protein